MTEAQRLARFACGARYEDLSPEARQALKIRVLDSLGCAIGAINGAPMVLLREHVTALGGARLCTLIGGGRTAPDRAAFYNSALVRYLDFNDSYLAKGETCHPSDNLGAVLAACEQRDRSGREFLTALAVAYQVQCRLSDVAPVRHKGFDHTTQGSYAVAAAVARALGLDPDRAAHAVAMAGTALNALRVTRTGSLSHWKGLAYPHTAFAATHLAYLAARGITGPLEVFEGNKGFRDAIAGPFSIDWESEDLERVRRTIVKKYNAEIHSQSAIEAALELRKEHGFSGEQVRQVAIEIFDVAYHIIGGGEEGDKTRVHTKEEADHSLPYIVAVALLDGQVLPEQYRAERIVRDDVQSLLRRVQVRPDPEFSRRFPEEMPCRVTIELHDGRVVQKEKRDYEGFHTRPMSWESAREKFFGLVDPILSRKKSARLLEAVEQLEDRPVRALTSLLARCSPGQRNRRIRDAQSS